MKKALYWFRYDLRLEDNTGWTHLVATHETVVGIFVLPERWLVPGRYQNKSIGYHRLKFLIESLQDLRKQLVASGSELIIDIGRPATVIASWVQTLGVDTLAVGAHPGSDEQSDISAVKSTITIPLVINENFTLFDRDHLPFALSELPDSFSQFRKQVEDQPISQPLAKPYPIRQAVVAEGLFNLEPLREQLNLHTPPKKLDSTLSFTGGTQAGLSQLKFYLQDSHLIAHYKETRNGLDGWNFSSKLSPWLAFGCISARQVARAIADYESMHTANESTYWLYFELLWREYFQWLAFRYGKKLFSLRGIKNKNPLLSFYPELFAAWCYGNTENEFINAFMRQLLHTGWMSNRGRQIVASYFINELGLDWRYGAAWFEYQLIDYDLAANWGNWQYLAGVGTDPRGRRQFNIEKQRHTYDPESTFIERWTNF